MLATSGILDSSNSEFKNNNNNNNKMTILPVILKSHIIDLDLFGWNGKLVNCYSSLMNVSLSLSLYYKIKLSSNIENEFGFYVVLGDNFCNGYFSNKRKNY